jgi:membrane protease YdiL (CAAX protease family)
MTAPVESTGRLRRLAEVTAFVAGWIAIGELINASEDLARQELYILLGIPLVAGFQLLIGRREIKELWVRDGPPLRLGRIGIIVAAALAIYPTVSAIEAISNSDSLSLILGPAVAIGGAWAAGYAFGLFDRSTWRYMALCILTATGWSVGSQLLFEYDAALAQHVVFHPDGDFKIFITALLLYLPTVFVLEEVVFRGALDTHAHHEGDRHGVLTAAYIAVLWSLWHAPLYDWQTALEAMTNMVPMGIFLSIYWRKSGNLGVNGSAHALADSVRNAMNGGAP